MASREKLIALKEKFGPAIQRADLPDDGRLVAYVDPASLKAVCSHLFRDLGARYIVTIGADDRPYSGRFLVVHDFAFDREDLLASIAALLPPGSPRVDSISGDVPAASWAEREMRDLVGIEPVGHRYPKRLVLPDGWPDGVHPLRKDVPWNFAPADYDETRLFPFDDPPPGCMVVPFGPFHPSLDEPAHFRLYVEGEMVRGCEYRGFMVHRGIEKLAESVMSYNEIPLLAERICGICGCVHSVAYVQSVESAAAISPPPRAEYIRTIMLEIERLHSHLLWVGLACHVVGFDTLFMQSFRIREPVMRIAEEITGNRKTYALCVVGGVRWNIGPEMKARLAGVLDRLEAEWRVLTGAVRRRPQHPEAHGRRRRGRQGPCGESRARRPGCAVGGRRHRLPQGSSVRSLRPGRLQCHHRGRMRRLGAPYRADGRGLRVDRDHTPMPGRYEGRPLAAAIPDELPAGRWGMSSVEAPRGESHHFVITGENNRPRRWRVRAPTYQNLQAIPAMIKDQQIADMTISLARIDPCFSCTDRLETVDLRSGAGKVWTEKRAPRPGAESARREPMSPRLPWSLAGAVLNTACVLVFAPLFQGIAAADDRPDPVPPRAASAAALFRPAEAAGQGGHRVGRVARPCSSSPPACRLPPPLSLACLVPMGLPAPMAPAGDGILLDLPADPVRNLHAAGRPCGGVDVIRWLESAGR